MMKNRVYPLLAALTVLFIVLVATPVIAQESPENEIPELNPNIEPDLIQEKPLLYEPEGKTSFTTVETEVPTSTSKSKTKISEVKSNTASKAEEDALSFNFLYYIIQKFKISDIVEKHP